MRSILCAFSLLALSTAFAQEQPDWSTLMKDPDQNFQEIIDLHKTYWPSPPDQPGQGYKPFERWKWLWQGRLEDDGTLPSGADVFRLWEEMREYNGSRSPEGNWFVQGPVLDNLTSRSNIDGVGRTSCIAFHPTNPDIVFAGTPAGGLWRSFDGGQTWSSNTDWLPTLGVSSIAFDPENGATIYAGTGDRDAADALGMGVMKSTDGGETWDFVNIGIEDLTVGAMKILLSGAILIGTNDGIFRSTDGGGSWTYVSPSSVDYKDMEVHPTNPDIVYATGAGKFFRSANGGLDWEWINEGISSGSRMVICVTPADPDRVYALTSTTFEFKSFYVSYDTGLTFTEMSEEPNILGWAADGSSDGGQAWYDLCIEADGTDPDVVYVGGIRMKKSVDQGVTWMDINPNYLHVDQHELIRSPYTQELWLANDGGLYRYVDNEEWLDISTSLINGQIYKLGQSPHNPYKVLNGFQDNGTSEFNGAMWQRRGGGDGFECLYDHTDESWRYGSIYYGQLYRTSPDFINQKIAGDGELGINESGAWSSPYLLAPWDENTMFVGLKNIWRTNNVKDPERDSIEWVKISSNLGGNDLTPINAMESCMSNINIMYCSEGNRKLFRSNNVNSAEPTWTTLSNSLPVFNTPVAAIETHPSDSNIVYISFNEDVYKSTDMGASWLNLSENFPDVNINTIVLDTAGAEEALYIGTDLGIYYTDATLGEWIPFNNGFPYSARVTELEIYYAPDHSESRIKAATYGRGMWESDLYGEGTTLFSPIAILGTNEPSTEVFDSFHVDLAFYKNLAAVEVSGLTADDIQIENGTVVSLTGGPVTYDLTIEPATYGYVHISVPDAVIEDLDGLPNFHSDTLSFVFSPAPEPFGPFGPGGVGDDSSVTFWLRADRSVFGNGNSPLSSDGQFAEQWRDVMGNDHIAWQTTDDRQPEYQTGENGINGNPALHFDGDNDWMSLEDVVPGRSISGYIMVEGDSIEFNDHGWFASARVSNGYLMHPWKSSSQYSAEVLDLEEHYSGSPVYYIGDAAAAHMYGFIYHQDDLHQVFQTVFDDKLWDFPGVNIGERNNTTPIDIRIGWDYEDRYGLGKIAEHFIYSRRLYTTHHIIVANYMAAKYGIDLGLLSRYDHPAQNQELIGIGQTTEFDFHYDAQGLSEVRISGASDMDNEEYLMIGQDNAGLDMIDQLYPIMSIRTERTWGFTQTGDVGTVLFRIEADALEATDNLGVIVTDTDEFMPGQTPEYFPLVLNGDYLEATIDFPQSGVFTIGVEPQVSITDLSFAGMSLFPNPADESVMVQLSNAWPDVWNVTLLDATGRRISASRHSGKSSVVSVQDLAPGIYFVEVEIEGQVIGRERLLVK